jgi:hypothetical protein
MKINYFAISTIVVLLFLQENIFAQIGIIY